MTGGLTLRVLEEREWAAAMRLAARSFDTEQFGTPD